MGLLILKFCSKLLKAFHSDATPNQIAIAITLGTIIGFTPDNTIMDLLIGLLILIVNVSIAGAIFGIFISNLLRLLLFPLIATPLSNLGESLLTLPALTPLFTALYNTPILALTNFNNTLVMGSLVLTLLAALPLTLASKKLVIKYRSKLMKKINQLKLIQALKASKWGRIALRIKGALS